MSDDLDGRRLKRRRLSETSEGSSQSSSSDNSDTEIISGEPKNAELSESEDDAPKLQFNFHIALNRVTKTTRTHSTRQPQTPKDATFASLGVKPSLVASLEAMSIRKPTPVQIGCLPSIISGRDCIGNAKTGSGKTMAFAIPILQKLSEDPYGIYALVLTPTRELAFQISEQFVVLGGSLNLRTAVIVGGMDMMEQALELGRRPHVVVATPGRLVDHMNSNGAEWSLSRLKFLVLDEADRLLTDTFADDLAKILSETPKDRQTCLFTATWTPAVENLANATPQPGKQKPFVYRMTDSVETVGTLKQHYLLVPSHVREPYLFYALCNPPESIAHMRVAAPEPQKPAHKSKKVNKAFRPPKVDQDAVKQPPPTMIFVSKPKTAAYLAKLLQTLGIRATALHSRLKQRDRLNSLNLFRSRVVPVLISTDVGARGLDIADVALVVNWDFPSAPEEYTHRVGRTARAGRNGMAISFVTERDEEKIHKVEARIGTTLTELSLPEEKVLEGLNAVSTAKRIANMELHDSDFGKREEVHAKKAAKLAQ
ncbi:ATP-dependent RNA helicase DBP8 OS=Cryptococcus neoformans var, neoformans serotype D (strain JEC21 / ATCC MYA-565) GN=DBP8 PE=3 SV=1 [Rhizoctonia solani AG-1 IB]|uniref:ATP-dependent RNA helicase DBP8 n=1 Tax=Thanatephorus cucumeris (strain AG1-IB / isolate 7/3/14) TaxID=1108050 RepID=A0A0B7FPH8_THACB|nr:ATP-dependent RNA helicase DBP8 OS=Cryptococcus neoformans var, neoformans serotype D (strain JEC21 / ATCC MYA-565) GN=DBP8 PE=3 SV=1 [Rhizoctonia solani AG-1 IB]